MKLSWLLLASFVAQISVVDSFQTQSTVRTTASSTRFSTSIAAKSLFEGLPELPNPFGKPASFSEPESFEYQPTPEGLIRQAKLVIATDLGLQDPSLLDESFQWIGPTFDQALGKTDYVAAGRFFDLRSAFPDLDYRAHDFRIPQQDDSTVRLTCRVTGTMRGELRLRSETLSPTGKTMQCPPEAVSMTFDKSTGKLVKLCTGFSMDRQVGNTQGTTGVMAAATIAGKPPSDWELYPPTTVLRRFFGRPVQPIKETKSVLAPFPETVMVQLAKGILAANMAVEDPTLLASKFEYSTPKIGPVKKKDYLEKYAAAEFADIDPSFSNFRVDLYDPVRVWVDVQPSGPGYEGSPQTMSFTFDEEGFCTRITSGYVMDPSIGNGGGLGGQDGYLYATGKAKPGFASRPLPRNLGRLRKRILSPVTKVGPDEYVSPASKSVVKPPPPMQPDTAVKESLSSLRAAAPPKEAPAKVPEPPKPPKAAPKREVPKLEFPKVELPKAPKVELPKVELPKAPKAAVKRAPKAPKAAAKSALKAPKAAAKLAPKAPKAAAKPAPKAPKAAAKLAPKAPKAAAKPAPKAPKAALRQAPKAPAKQAPKSTTPAPFFVSAPPQIDADKKQAEARRKQAQVKAEQERKQKEAKAEAERQKAEAARKQEQARAEADRKRKEADARKKEQAKARQRELEAQKAEAERKRKEAEAKQKEQAEARRQLDAQKAEEKRQREEQRRMEQEAKKAAAEAKKAEVERKRQEAQAAKVAAAEARKAEAERKRQEAQTAKAAAAEAKAQKAKQAQIEQQNKSAAAKQKKQEKAAVESLAQAASRATLSLFGLSSGDEGPAPLPEPVTKTSKKAPRGVPTISRWRKNSDGSVTGLISGSRNFAEGERVTTSPIGSGTVAPGEVVRTGSGSRYFLS